MTQIKLQMFFGLILVLMQLTNLHHLVDQLRRNQVYLSTLGWNPNINKLIIDSISISMSRKQAIIRLGRSKSPSSRRKDSESSLYRTQSIASSKQKEPLHQTSILNQSMHVSPSQPPPPCNAELNFIKTHSGFFPPSPQSVQQKVVIKENVRSPMRNPANQSPRRVLIASQSSMGNSVHVMNAQVIQPSEREKQLLRKVTVLETRVQELHQEKQMCVVRAHEETKRLVAEVEMLRAKLFEVENVKNRQIAFFQAELHKAKQTCAISLNQKNAEQVATGLNKIKNNIYVEQDEEKEPSIKGHDIQQPAEVQRQADKNQIRQLTQANKGLQARVKQLQDENSQLEGQLSQMKEAVLRTTEIIEQNNKKIVENYEQKLSVLHEELSCFKENTDDSNEASQLLKSKQEECQSLKKHLGETLNLLREQNIERDNGQNEFVAKISELATELNEKQARIEEAQEKIKQLEHRLLNQPKSTSGVESCRKCSQLIKTLVKLNNRSAAG